MIWVLYSVESLIVGAGLTAAVGLGLWLHHHLLWLPLVLVGAGYLLRLGRRVPTWVSGWHGAVRRRIEER